MKKWKRISRCYTFFMLTVALYVGLVFRIVVQEQCNWVHNFHSEPAAFEDLVQGDRTDLCTAEMLGQNIELSLVGNMHTATQRVSFKTMKYLMPTGQCGTSAGFNKRSICDPVKISVTGSVLIIGYIHRKDGKKRLSQVL